MNITDIKVRKIFKADPKMKALISITIDHDFAVHDIKVIEGPDRLFLAMPARKGDDKVFHDVVHPINAETRNYMEDTILQAYRQYIEDHPDGR